MLRQRRAFLHFCGTAVLSISRYCLKLSPLLLKSTWLPLFNLARHAQAKAYSPAANMYGAALIYAATDMDKAQTARQLALCHLGMGQQSKYVLIFAPCSIYNPLSCAACQAFDSEHHVARALDYIDIAEQSQPGTINAALIRFKVLLAMGNSDGAMQQLERCMACSDFEPIYLTVCGPRSWHGHAYSSPSQARNHMHALCAQVATQEAYSAGATAMVKCGLLKQYELAKSGAAPGDGCKPGHEATILRGLIGISLKSLESKAEHQRLGQAQQEHGAAAPDAAAPAPTTPASGKGGSGQGPAVGSYVEISGYFNQASRRLLEVGAAGFFGDDDVRSAAPAGLHDVAC